MCILFNVVDTPHTHHECWNCNENWNVIDYILITKVWSNYNGNDNWVIYYAINLVTIIVIGYICQ